MPIRFGLGADLLMPRAFPMATWVNPSPRKISGVTRDSAGVAMAGVVVDLYRTVNDVFVASTVSDAVGGYAFDVALTDGPFYLVAYKAGAPDQAGTTVNTLVGA